MERSRADSVLSERNGRIRTRAGINARGFFPMKRWLAVGAILMIWCAGFTGCTITDTVYLQELNTTTPVNQPPIHLNAEDRDTWFHVSPRVSYSPSRLVTGNIEGSGPYKTTDKNLRWNIPAASYAIDVDWRVTRLLAFTGGMNYGKAGAEGFWGGNAGLGLLFGGGTIAGRLDAGVHFQRVSYEAASVVETDILNLFSPQSTKTVGYFLDEGNAGTTALYGALTLNTRAPESLVNGYLQLAVGGQNVADFNPSQQYLVAPYVDVISTDARVQSSSTYLMLSPGLYFNLSEGVRLMTGVRLAWELDIEDPSPAMLVLPMVQCEFSL